MNKPLNTAGPRTVLDEEAALCTSNYIRGTKLTTDPYQHVNDGSALPASGDVLVSLDRISAALDHRAQGRGRVGVVVDAQTDVTVLQGALAELSLIDLRFSHYNDGRGYSQARLLRERFGFEGELRASGAVGVDHLFALRNVGFDAYVIVGELLQKNVDAAFARYSTPYLSLGTGAGQARMHVEG